MAAEIILIGLFGFVIYQLWAIRRHEEFPIFVMGGKLPDEPFRLVTVFGDIPYVETEINPVGRKMYSCQAHRYRVCWSSSKLCLDSASDKALTKGIGAPRVVKMSSDVRELIRQSISQ